MQPSGRVTFIMFKENIYLARLGSFRIGGPSRYFFEARSKAEIEAAVKKAKADKLDIFVLGGGTNLLPSDEGYEGLVLKPNLWHLERAGSEIKVGAGVLMSELLDFAAHAGLSGLEWAGGLPGTVGGAIRGNAGAFGGEIKDVVKAVTSYDTEMFRELERFNEECKFDYRSSLFKTERNGREIILGATLTLKSGDPEKIREEMNAKIAYRQERHPLEYPNIGSIFKNVDLEKIPISSRAKFAHVVKPDPFPVVPAAYLISEAGLKGVTHGGAMVSPKHPNFIVNVLWAKANDVKNLIELTKSEVHKRFGIKLEEEVIQL